MSDVTPGRRRGTIRRDSTQANHGRPTVTDTAPPTGGLTIPPPTAPPPPPNVDPIGIIGTGGPAPAPQIVIPDTVLAELEAKVKAFIAEEIAKAVAPLTGEATNKILATLQDFSGLIDAGGKRVAALVQELERGGLVARLHELEMAVASLAAPTLNPHDATSHDAHGLLINWFAGVGDVFKRVAEGFRQAKADAQAQVNAAAAQAPAPAPTPAVAQTNPAAAAVAAMGLPAGSLGTRPPG